MTRGPLLFLLLLGCVTERDYTLAACPSPSDLVGLSPSDVCDLGIGGNGDGRRFVSTDECVRLSGRDPARLSGLFCAHPFRSVCVGSSPAVRLCTFDDVMNNATYR